MPQPAALLATTIQRLLAEHVEHPLRHLHERSLHARLGHLLLAALPDAERFAAAEVAFGHHGYRSRDRVLRVQHELKLHEAGALPAAGTVLLRQGTGAQALRLERLGGGHLDLAPAVRAQDAVAVIELASAASADAAERERCRATVGRLHELARACSRTGASAPECHFVFIDRAMPVREHASCGGSRRELQWETVPQGTDSRGWSWAGAGRLGTSHVHVWDFDEGADVRHRIAVA